MTPTKDKFVGCLWGALLGDVLGAPVEGKDSELLRFLHEDFGSIVNLTARGGTLQNGRPLGMYTDDMQMTLCVTKWLIHDTPDDSLALFERFASAYEPWRLRIVCLRPFQVMWTNGAA